MINSIQPYQNNHQIKSFVLRARRMSTGQCRGWNEHWDRFGLKKEDGLLNIHTTFDRKAPVVLEIGYGMGLSLIAMAKAESDKNFIGVEVYRPGVGSLLNGSQQAGLNNIRTYCNDAVEVLRDCITNDSLSRLQIYFPDSWHKKRHHKRRLIQLKFIDAIRSKLILGGVIHLTTDWEDYAKQMMKVLTVAKGFKNKEVKEKYSPRPSFRPLTKFEKRGHQLCHNIWDLLFERIE